MLISISDVIAIKLWCLRGTVDEVACKYEMVQTKYLTKSNDRNKNHTSINITSRTLSQYLCLERSVKTRLSHRRIIYMASQ